MLVLREVNVLVIVAAPDDGAAAAAAWRTVLDHDDRVFAPSLAGHAASTGVSRRAELVWTADSFDPDVIDVRRAPGRRGLARVLDAAMDRGVVIDRGDWARVVTRFRMMRLPYPLYYYRTHPDSMTSRSPDTNDLRRRLQSRHFRR